MSSLVHVYPDREFLRFVGLLCCVMVALFAVLTVPLSLAYDWRVAVGLNGGVLFLCYRIALEILIPEK